MNYFGATINDSSTIAEKTGAELTDAMFCAVKYDANGDVVTCGAGEVAIGVILPETPAKVAKGDDVTIQIRNIGYAKSGAAIVKGAMVASDATGKLITAVAGNFVVGIAMSAAAKADAVFSIDIRKCGYVPATI